MPRRALAVSGLVAAALAAVAVAAGCGTVGRVETGSAARGKELFKDKCAQCHALADAGSQSQVGPDLDAAFRTLRSDAPGQGFKESTIREVVRGQIAYPIVDPPTDAPGMPANLVTGEDADAVAAYVASVAGVPGKNTGDGGGGQAAQGNDPEALFSSAGCAGCHALAKAGATGNVGPDLDKSKPTAADAAAQIREGGGGMPAYKDRLSEQQIKALAEFIAGE